LAKLNLKIHEMKKKEYYSSSFLSLKMDKVLESLVTPTTFCHLQHTSKSKGTQREKREERGSIDLFFN
jgi:hypothetical protein